MAELNRMLRRLLLRWQLRSLEQQAENIIEARNHALARLMQIRRECDQKQMQLLLCDSAHVYKAVV